eukprot:m.17915 g.17915  ORF g.17915 m.17915 type:complete len:430 (+) comp27566_c0_seq1:172-1461(+)
MDVIHHPKTVAQEDEYLSIDTQPQPSKNPFTEVQILEGHKDITRRLFRLENDEFVSAGDDGRVIVWDGRTGRCLHTLEGHQRPVTALMLMPCSSGSALLSASSGGEIRMWRNTDDETAGKVLREHHGSVKCLLPWNEGFCTGGEKLCLWSQKGEMLVKLSRPSEDSDVVGLVAVKNDRLIAATANSAHLDVYQIRTSDSKPSLHVMPKKLYGHREAVRCLVTVSEALFASGSIDGSILLWSSHTLSYARCLNFEEKYMEEKMLLYEVSQLLVISEHLLAAVGRGFQVHNVNRPQGESLLALRRNAHLGNIHGLAYLDDKNLLITCSEDAKIRLWEVSLVKLQSQGKIKMRKASFSANVKRPALIGELVGHSSRVHSVIDLSPHGFASCGTDSLVLLWKEGNEENKKRIEKLRMRHEHERDCEMLALRLT